MNARFVRIGLAVVLARSAAAESWRSWGFPANASTSISAA